MRAISLKNIFFSFLILLVPGLVSCHDNYTLCDQSLNVNANCQFYIIDAGGNAIPAAPARLSVTGIMGNPIITDIQNIPLLSLFLTPNTDSAKFIFSINNGTKDTVSFYYNTRDLVP